MICEVSRQPWVFRKGLADGGEPGYKQQAVCNPSDYRGNGEREVDSSPDFWPYQHYH